MGGGRWAVPQEEGGSSKNFFNDLLFMVILNARFENTVCNIAHILSAPMGPSSTTVTTLLV